MKRWLFLLGIVVAIGATGMVWRWLHPAPLSDEAHILIDVSLNRLYLFDDGDLIKRYPVGTGREFGLTPRGCFTIVNRFVLSGNGNPALGSHWLGLSAPPGPLGGSYGIHGTDEPHLIGQHVSAGCVRMSPEDIADLYARVEEGTMVCIRAGPRWLWQVGDWLQRPNAHPA